MVSAVLLLLMHATVALAGTLPAGYWGQREDHTAPATAPGPAPCDRPSDWCAAPSTFSEVDCDGDGALDLACSDPERGYATILSSQGCVAQFGESTQATCPRAFGSASVQYSIASNGSVEVHFDPTAAYITYLKCPDMSCPIIPPQKSAGGNCPARALIDNQDGFNCAVLSDLDHGSMYKITAVDLNGQESLPAYVWATADDDPLPSSSQQLSRRKLLSSGNLANPAVRAIIQRFLNYEINGREMMLEINRTPDGGVMNDGGMYDWGIFRELGYITASNINSTWRDPGPDNEGIAYPCASNYFNVYGAASPTDPAFVGAMVNVGGRSRFPIGIANSWAAANEGSFTSSSPIIQLIKGLPRGERWDRVYNYLWALRGWRLRNARESNLAHGGDGTTMDASHARIATVIAYLWFLMNRMIG